MTLRRKCHECQRLFRHRWFCLFLFAVASCLFIFSIGVWQSTLDGAVQQATMQRQEEFESAKAHWKDESETNVPPAGGRPRRESKLVESSYKKGVIGNYEPAAEPQISAPGEEGRPIREDSRSPEVQRAFSEFGFNTHASDQIRMNRTIPDTRSEACKYWHYPSMAQLPTASVVVVFHNEGWSPLLRTVHSVLDRSPRELLKEVLMVDDFSDKEHLKSRLDNYLTQFNGRVRLIRNQETGVGDLLGVGAKLHKLFSDGEVVIFLDAHCEANSNWLVPLLAPIAADRKVMTVPVIDGIDMTTWSYRKQYGGSDTYFRGIFEWGLLYKEAAIPQQELDRLKYPAEPFRSPTHAGGLFAINRAWFEQLGYYDPGLLIWGGEQYELSFKIWQCGGGILFVPCSRVGHVYRARMPYGFGKLKGPIISTNLKRVVEVWMDEYKQYYYIREPFMSRRELTDVSAQVALREKNQCKSFKWYMENVAYDVPKLYPPQPPNVAWGEARNEQKGTCLDTMGTPIPGSVGQTPCHGYGGNQLFRINTEGQLTQGEWCVTPVGSGRLRTDHCRKGHVDGPWEYRLDTHQIAEKSSNKCLEPDNQSTALHLNRCDVSKTAQRWTWKEIWV